MLISNKKNETTIKCLFKMYNTKVLCYTFWKVIVLWQDYDVKYVCFKTVMNKLNLKCQCVKCNPSKRQGRVPGCTCSLWHKLATDVKIKICLHTRKKMILWWEKSSFREKTGVIQFLWNECVLLHDLTQIFNF